MPTQTALDFTAAQEARDAGIEMSGEHADRTESGWRYQALALLTAFASEHPGAFLIESAREYAQAHGLPSPPDGRAWGSVVRLAVSKRRIRKAGYGPAASSNCSPKCLWVAITEPAQAAA